MYDGVNFWVGRRYGTIGGVCVGMGWDGTGMCWDGVCRLLRRCQSSIGGFDTGAGGDVARSVNLLQIAESVLLDIWVVCMAG